MKRKIRKTSPKMFRPCSTALEFFTGHFSQFCTRYFKHNFKFFSRTDPCSVYFGCESPKFWFAFCCGLLVWESETVSANRVAAINPPIDDTDPIRKFSIDFGSHTDLQNAAEFSPQGKPIRNFSIDPTSSIRTRLRTPFLRTPFPRLLIGVVFSSCFSKGKGPSK